MRELCLVLPGWDLPPEYLSLGTALPHWHVPTLDVWRRFGVRRRVDFHAGDFMAHTFSGSLKAKIVTDLALPDATPAFLAAPVSQHMDMYSMQLVAGRELALSWTEAHRVCRALNEWLADNGWQCHVYRPDLWLVTCPAPLDWHAPDIWTLGNRADASSKITGKDANIMLKKLTEIQMWLFAQSAALPRMQGLPPINGVWLWPDTVGRAARPTAVAGQAAWLPEADHVWQGDAFSWQEIAVFADRHPRVTVYVDAAQRALDAADLAEHAAFLQAFDEHMFAPAWQAVRQGRLAQIDIVGARTVLRMNAAQRWHIWRRAKPYRGAL